jgi:hypothetical protein
MFNKDFFPTPHSVIDLMQIDCINRTALEPSAGKGNIVDYLKINGAKEILSCEKNKDLAEIVKTKSKFIDYDFLKIKAEQISHVNLIVMNPPFSNGCKHVLHAWEIAPSGCEIISLINYDTLDNDYTRERKELTHLVKDYGTCENLGDVFNEAERKTDVQVGLIKLYKSCAGENEFQGFFMDEDEETPSGNGIMPYNCIKDVVQRYVQSVKCFDEHMVLNEKLNGLNNLFDVGTFKFHLKYNDTLTTREEYKKGLQKAAWKYIFSAMKIEKYVTTGVMRDINNFVETQTKIPFTMKNIYRMFDIIIGTREQTFNRSLEEAIDKFTKHTHENRYHCEGWKTNAGHLLNKKIIIPYVMEKSYDNYLYARYGSYHDGINDLLKVICALTGTNYDDVTDLGGFCRNIRMQPNTWYSWSFFEIKGFKKGTLHMKFQNEKVWETVNRAYAKLKGAVLPEKF